MPRWKRSQRPRWAALAVSLVMILAACGQPAGDDVGADTSAPSTTAAPTTTAPTTTTAPPTTTSSVADEMHDDEDMHDDEGAHEDEHDDAVTAASGDWDREIAVTMTEFAYEPATLAIAPGETIRFVVTNAGVIEHEFRIDSEHAMKEHIEGGHDHGHEDEMAANILLLGPGEEGELIVTFTDTLPEDLQFGCLIEGHYEAGMLGAFEIQSN